MSLPIVILGAGGHAKVLAEALRAAGATVLGLTDADPAKCGTAVLGFSVLGSDAALERYDPANIQLVNGIGSVGRTTKRTTLFEAFKARGFTFATVVHPAAVVAADVVLGEGVQVMAGTIVQPGTTVGGNSILNTGAVIDHDCAIGDHVHIAPGVMLSGGVSIGRSSHIGTGATVVQGICIGGNCLVAAGAVVVRNVPDGVAVSGVPAKEID